MTSISDGTSNTMLIGEKFQTNNAEVNECNTDQGYIDGWDNDMIVFSQGAEGQSVPTGFSNINMTNPPTPGFSFPRNAGRMT